MWRRWFPGSATASGAGPLGTSASAVAVARRGSPGPRSERSRRSVRMPRRFAPPAPSARPTQTGCTSRESLPDKGLCARGTLAAPWRHRHRARGREAPSPPGMLSLRPPPGVGQVGDDRRQSGDERDLRIVLGSRFAFARPNARPDGRPAASPAVGGESRSSRGRPRPCPGRVSRGRGG